MLRHSVSSWTCTVDAECRAPSNLNRKSSLQPMQ